MWGGRPVNLCPVIRTSDLAVAVSRTVKTGSRGGAARRVKRQRVFALKEVKVLKDASLFFFFSVPETVRRALDQGRTRNGNQLPRCRLP